MSEGSYTSVLALSETEAVPIFPICTRYPSDRSCHYGKDSPLAQSRMVCDFFGQLFKRNRPFRYNFRVKAWRFFLRICRGHRQEIIKSIHDKVINKAQGESKCLGEKMEKWMRSALAPEDMCHCLPLHSGPFCNPLRQTVFLRKLYD